MDELTNVDIARLLRNQSTGEQRKQYGGIYMSDQLKDIEPKQGKFYVVNLGNTHNKDTREGTHWTCVYNGMINSIYYYDSFGMPPNRDVEEFLKRARNPKTNKPKRIYYNTMDHQNINSSACGFFVVWMLLGLLNGKSFISMILTPDAFNTWLNDKLVKKIKSRDYIDEL